jgi:Fe-Mn family superoxide dismutase
MRNRYIRKYTHKKKTLELDIIMPFTIPELPYTQDELEPHISAKTLGFHYGKHHQAYATNLNKLIVNTDLDSKSLEDIIKLVALDSEKVGIFNNAAQVWNHTFYWKSMKPKGGGAPSGELAERINNDFGGYKNFKKEFKEAASTQFGSGWAWLVLMGDKLEIIKTGNASLPMINGQTALLTCDIWEHAYYLDYQNRRPDYVDAFLDHLVNWDFVKYNLEKS